MQEPNAQIVPSNEQPLRDEERAIHDLDKLSSQAHLLHDKLSLLAEGDRTLDAVGQVWAQRHIPDLLAESPQLVEMIVKDPAAIHMCDRMFVLMRLRQEGSISGTVQDMEFARLVAKSYLPQNLHAEIDKKVEETVASLPT